MFRGHGSVKGEKNMIYARIKKLIEKGAYEKEDMLKKLDVFLLMNRITEEQYQELIGMMG